MDPVWYWAILIAANTPVYFGLGWVLFDDWEGFFEALRYWLTPDAWSWIRGEWFEDFWAEFKLAGWIALCGAIVLGEHWLIQKVF